MPTELPSVQTQADVAWESCTLRSWLNGVSWGQALSPAQQGAVVPQTLTSADNIEYGTNGADATTDNVFLLTESDDWSADAAVRPDLAAVSSAPL